MFFYGVNHFAIITMHFHVDPIVAFGYFYCVVEEIVGVVLVFQLIGVIGIVKGMASGVGSIWCPPFISHF